MIRYFLPVLAAFCLVSQAFAGEGAFVPRTEDEINFYCLQKSYPQIKALRADAAGQSWLEFADGKKVLYSGSAPGQEVDVKESMRLPYPLEPDREDPAASPGRQRSYALFRALYGENAAEVKKGLRRVKLPRGSLSLAAPAALALAQGASELEKIAADPGVRALLKPDGGYFWRKIAGEDNLSAHSFGIALDLAADKAPYWRWSRQMPHPMQKTYPGSIVKTMEDLGFIWGGKWREYDLMHFEYRPELICKAKMRREAMGPHSH